MTNRADALVIGAGVAGHWEGQAGTVHGAIASGWRAAEQVMRVCRKG